MKKLSIIFTVISFILVSLITHGQDTTTTITTITVQQIKSAPKGQIVSPVKDSSIDDDYQAYNLLVKTTLEDVLKKFASLDISMSSKEAKKICKGLKKNRGYDAVFIVKIAGMRRGEAHNVPLVVPDGYDFSDVNNITTKEVSMLNPDKVRIYTKK